MAGNLVEILTGCGRNFNCSPDLTKMVQIRRGTFPLAFKTLQGRFQVSSVLGGKTVFRILRPSQRGLFDRFLLIDHSERNLPQTQKSKRWCFKWRERYKHCTILELQ